MRRLVPVAVTGWEKVAGATGVAVLGLAGLNLAIWRRVKRAVAAGRSAAKIEQDDQGQIESFQIIGVERADHVRDALLTREGDPVDHQL